MNEPIKGIQADLTGRVPPPTGAPATFEAVPVSSAYVIVLSSVAAIGGFLFGFDSGVINGTVDALASAFGTRAAGTGFAVASVLLGCAVGAFVAGTIADVHGRRPTMLLNAVLFLASAFATGAAGSAGFFITSRIVGGLAIGAASVLAPMYIAEVAPAHMRGRLASLQQMAIVLGLFSAFLSNDIIARIAGGAGAIFWLGAPAWRWMFWMEAVPAAAFLLGVLFIPESPRFLIYRGKSEQARQIFARIGGDAVALVQQVEQSLRGEHGAGLSAANLYIVAFGVSWGPVMWVLLGEMFPNQLRGAALAVSGATNWAANFAVTVTFLPLLNAAGLAGAYALYAIGAVLSLPFVWTAVRATKGKPLEHM